MKYHDILDVLKILYVLRWPMKIAKCVLRIALICCDLLRTETAWVAIERVMISAGQNSERTPSLGIASVRDVCFPQCKSSRRQFVRCLWEWWSPVVREALVILPVE
jgi:hypothetical protein